MPPESAAPPRERPLRDRLIAPERAAVALSVAALVAIAWIWLVAAPPGSDGMAAGHAGMAMPDAAPDPWSAGYLLPAFAMWTLMMVAMMLPSAAPMILLYDRVAARAGGGSATTAVFLLTYLGIWTAFAGAAAVAQALLIASGAIDAMALAVGDGRIAGALLLLAALYQLSPLKRACLEQCRSPLAFIMRLSRPGVAGTLRLGLAHGLYCLGCCWALMLLLFAGGVMNLAWIAALSLFVLAEKHAPAQLRIRLLGAVLLMAGGAFLIMRPEAWP